MRNLPPEKQTTDKRESLKFVGVEDDISQKSAKQKLSMERQDITHLELDPLSALSLTTVNEESEKKPEEKITPTESGKFTVCFYFGCSNLSPNKVGYHIIWHISHI